MNKHMEKLFLVFTILVFIPHILNGLFFDYRGIQPLDNIAILLKIVVLCFIEIYLLINYRKGNGEKRFKNYRKYFILVLFTSITFIINFAYLSLFTQINSTFLVKDLIIGLINQFILFSFTFLLISNFFSNDLIKKTCSILIYISTFGILFNFLFKFQEFNKFLYPNVSSTLNFRSFYENRNYFGFTLVLSTIFLVKCNSENKSKNKLKVLLISLHIISIVLTMSRNSILILMIYFVVLNISLNFYKIKSKIQGNYKFILRSVILSLAAIILISNIPFIKSYLRLDNLFSDRLGLWKISLDTFKNNKIFGVGNFELRNILTLSVGRRVQPHSYIFNGLASYGILLFTLLNLQFVGFISILVKRNPSNKAAIYAFTVALVFYSLFETVEFYGIALIPTLIMFFYIIMAENNFVKS